MMNIGLPPLTPAPCVSCKAQAQLLRDSTTYSGLGPLSSISNLKIVSQMWLQANLMEAVPPWRFLPSQVVLVVSRCGCS